MLLLSASMRLSRCGEMTELAEGARLEIVCAPKAYLGFESLSLRHRRYAVFQAWQLEFGRKRRAEARTIVQETETIASHAEGWQSG